MTKVFCDSCGAEVHIGKSIKADIDENHLVEIDIRPTILHTTKDGAIFDPDLCITCIIKALKNA